MRVFLVVIAFLFWFGFFTAEPSRADTFAFVPQSDGTIARFHADIHTGKLVLLPGSATDIGIHRPITLILSADKRFLYVYPTFDLSRDGFILDDLDNQTRNPTAHNKPTPILVLAVEQNGELRQIQTVVVPGPVGQVVCHPSRRFVYALTDGGAFLLKTSQPRAGGAPAGSLAYTGRVNLSSGMGLVDIPGERDAWWLTFSPSGNYLYDFRGDGFVDHAENYLQRYRVNAATGQPAKDGEEARDNNEGYALSAGTKPGAVYCFVGRTAFIAGFATGCAVCPADANGKISAKGSHYSLMPTRTKENGGYVSHDEQTLIKHPTLPLLVYRGSFADSYTIWRVAAPGKVQKVGTFASAFGTAPAHSTAIDGSGRFLYETASPDALVKAPAVAVFALSKNGTRAKLSLPPCPLPFGSDVNLTLVDVKRSVPRTVSRGHTFHCGKACFGRPVNKPVLWRAVKAVGALWVRRNSRCACAADHR